jgi:hypothetical protein
MEFWIDNRNKGEMEKLTVEGFTELDNLVGLGRFL